jgi:DNA-binding GntR family transcriptional regulator
MSHAADHGRPESLVSYAERRIKAALAEGAIAPGSRLSPYGLAREFGLSHIPIREALASLATEGHIAYEHGRGYLARRLSAGDLADIEHWRDVLEREAYLLGVPALTEADLARMRHLLTRMGQLAADSDRQEYARAHREFHFVVFGRAGSPRLLRFLGYLWDAAAPYLSLRPASHGEIHSEHLALMPGFAARDAHVVIKALPTSCSR